MKLSEQLEQNHNSGDFGEALEGYAERAKELEDEIELLRKADNTLQSLRDAAIKNKCGTMAARMKNGEVIILVTKNAETPEKDIMTAMMQLFPS